jgi:hypothetical protein
VKPSHQLESAVEQLYRQRFPAGALAARAAVWRMICRSCFALYVLRDGRVFGAQFFVVERKAS